MLKIGPVGKHTLQYDKLVLAIGSKNSAPPHALPLTNLADGMKRIETFYNFFLNSAEKIRRTTVQAYEKANALMQSGADSETLRFFFLNFNNTKHLNRFYSF